MYASARTASRASAPTMISTNITGAMLTPFRLGRDLRGVDRLGDDDDLVAVDGQEPSVDAGGGVAAGGPDAHVTLDEDAEQRGVAGQDAQLAIHGPGQDHVGLALPDLAVGGDEFNLQGAHGVLHGNAYCSSLATVVGSPSTGGEPWGQPERLAPRPTGAAATRRRRRFFSISAAWRSTSSRPPHMKNACSGTWS